MSSFYQSGMKIGILGGGQLGRMFIQEAIDFDVEVHILDSDENAPCRNIAKEFTLGSILDFDTVYNFGKDKDVITIEIENVNVDALEKLEQEGKKVYPQPHIIRLIKDKGLQKSFYSENKIPTAPFKLIAKNESLSDHQDFLPFMQKLRTGGYDGRGVQAIKSSADFELGFSEASVLESFVDFEKELSVIVSRNADGQIKSYPLVELEFNPEANLVEFLFAPANVSPSIEEVAKDIAESIIEKLGMVGILAVELFLTKTGQVLVNEIAPRPHNSGHQTIEANYTSQYQQHLRAILNLPLGATGMLQPSVMVNLLGEKENFGEVKYQGFEKIMSWPGVYPHLYGKRETKPFRKMGHITILNPELDTAKEIAVKVKETLKAVGK